MALVKLQTHLAQVSGKVPGAVFRSVAGRTLASNAPAPVRAATPQALDAKSRRQFAAATWSAMLPAVRQSWSTAAASEHPPHGAVGGSNWTGRQIYTMICCALDWLGPPSLLWCPYQTGLLPLASLSVAGSPFSIVASATIYAGQPAAFMALDYAFAPRPGSWRRRVWMHIGTFIAVAPWLPDYEIIGQITARTGHPQTGARLAVRGRLIAPGYFPSPWAQAETVLS